MLYYYPNHAEYKFFEEQRFNENNLPKYEDIEFMSKYIDFIKVTDENRKEKISLEIYNKLKPIIYYDNTKNSKIPTLREEAIKNQPLIEKYIENGEIVPFEKFNYTSNTSLLEATKKLNVENFSSLYEYLVRGEHIGNCGQTARLFYLLYNNNPTIKLNDRAKALPLVGTKNSENGGHVWLEVATNGGDYILDSSLLLAIPVELKKELGYTDGYIEDRDEVIDSNYNDSMVYLHMLLNKKYETNDKASYMQYKEYIKNLVKEER